MMKHALSALQRHRHALAGIADQGVIGIGNLVIGLVVLRTSSKEDYGTYGLFYMTLILLNGFANALLMSQLNVTYHRRADQEAAAVGTLGGQALIGGLLTLAGCLAALVLPEAVLPPGARLLLAVSALACPIVMMQDFLRGYLFLVNRGATALVLDILLIVGWLAGTLLLGPAIGASTALAALESFGLAAMLSVGTGLMASRLPLRGALSGARRALVESWGQGRWALGGAVVTALQNQAHIYILAAMASASALAELNAARMLMMPAGLFILGIGRSLVPALARLAAESRPDAMRRLANRTLYVVLAVVALYSAVIGLGHTIIIGRVLGNNYADIGHLVALWMVVFMLQALDNNCGLILQVTQRFRQLTLVNLWTVVPVLLAAFPMIKHFGPEGNLLTLAGGYIGLAFLLVPRSRRALASLPATGEAPVPPKSPGRNAELILDARAR